MYFILVIIMAAIFATGSEIADRYNRPFGITVMIGSAIVLLYLYVRCIQYSFGYVLGIG